MKKVFSFLILCSMALFTACNPTDSNNPEDPTDPNNPENPTDTDDPEQNNEGKMVAVDLGLSVKWATCNVGANKPEEYGDYFAWGETKPKEIFDYNTYKWFDNEGSSGLTKYCTNSDFGRVDNKSTLELSDDAAHANWGGSLRMPTKEETDELINNCNWTWTTKSDIRGFLGTSKKNGKSIFFPTAGYRNEYGSLVLEQNYGCYWSSDLDKDAPSDAWYLGVSSRGSVRIFSSGRSYSGLSVRPVCP